MTGTTSQTSPLPGQKTDCVHRVKHCNIISSQQEDTKGLNRNEQRKEQTLAECPQTRLESKHKVLDKGQGQRDGGGNSSDMWSE